MPLPMRGSEAYEQLGEFLGAPHNAPRGWTRIAPGLYTATPQNERWLPVVPGEELHYWGLSEDVVLVEEDDDTDRE